MCARGGGGCLCFTNAIQSNFESIGRHRSLTLRGMYVARTWNRLLKGCLLLILILMMVRRGCHGGFDWLCTGRRALVLPKVAGAANGVFVRVHPNPYCGVHVVGVGCVYHQTGKVEARDTSHLSREQAVCSVVLST